MRSRLAIAGALVGALLVASDAGAGASAPDGKLDGDARTRAIDSLLRLLEDNYVFPDAARAMGKTVRERAAGGRYDGLDGPGLAAALTRDLQDASRDRHLRVEYSAETLPPEPAEGDPLLPRSEELAAMRKDLARDNFGFKKVEILEGNLGYIRLDLFTPPEFAGDVYAAALTFVAQTDALIVDLRHNGGSIHPDAVPLLCSYFFARPVRLCDLYWRPGNRTDVYWTRADHGRHRMTRK